MPSEPRMRSATQAAPKATGHAYVLEGTVMEACNCDVLCPCCVGENPDNGTCDSVLAYHIDRGQINGVDVSNLTVLAAIHSPGNMFEGHWKRALVLDKRASHDQSLALTEAFEGRLGGPLGDLATLVSERAEITWATMEYSATPDQGGVTSGNQIRAEATSIRSRTDGPVTLSQTMFTSGQTSPPARIGKTSELRVNLANQGLTFNFKGSHAAQGEFHFEA